MSYLSQVVASQQRLEVAMAIVPSVSDLYERGAIVYNSWGYDQTNIDFYVISKRRGAFVDLLPMSSKNDYSGATMTGRAMPDKVAADAKPLRRKVKSRDGKEIGLQIESYGWCQLWDGSPKEYSTYA